MKDWLSCLAISYMVQMLGWLRADAARASRRKRSSACGSWQTLQAGTSGRRSDQVRVLGLIDHTHPATAQLLHDAVVRNGLADHAQECYGGSGGKSMKAVELAVSQEDCWRKIAISNNVGGVKHDCAHTTACTRRRAPFRSRRWFALSNLGSLLIVGVRNSVRPIHLFDHNRDHDYFFELPSAGERDAQSLRR